MISFSNYLEVIGHIIVVHGERIIPPLERTRWAYEL